jgi:ABC-type multidrug transport system ATPase subunit
MAAIETTNLTEQHDGVTVIDGLDEKSEVFGFLGPNGAEKSIGINVLPGWLVLSLMVGFLKFRTPELTSRDIQ